MRQKLWTAEDVRRFPKELEELTVASEARVVFEDFDTAQNSMSLGAFEKFFSILSTSKCHVERFRAFGCPTFDDHVCTLLAEWLLEAE